MTNCDQISVANLELEKSTGRRLHLQQTGGSQENGTNHKKENGQISNDGTRGQYSLSDPSAFFCKILAHSHF